MRSISWWGNWLRSVTRRRRKKDLSVWKCLPVFYELMTYFPSGLELLEEARYAKSKPTRDEQTHLPERQKCFSMD